MASRFPSPWAAIRIRFWSSIANPQGVSWPLLRLVVIFPVELNVVSRLPPEVKRAIATSPPVEPMVVSPATTMLPL